MPRDRGQRARAEFGVAEARHERRRPRGHFAARGATHGGADQLELEPAAVSVEWIAAGGDEGAPPEPGTPLPTHPASEIGPQRVGAGDRSVEIEDRDPHRGATQAASWRSTKCRIPPFSMYSHSFGVSTRRFAAKRVTLPDGLVAVTRASRLPFVRPSKS